MKTRDSYDRLAATYTDHVAGELEHKPWDRELLARFAGLVRGRGPVADVGCGPGHVGRFLADMGLPVLGVDLSPGMLEQARQLQPDLEFHCADMRRLPAGPGEWAGLVAFYSLIHVPPEELGDVLAEFHRVLAPGGLLLLSVHVGEELVHLEELWSVPVELDFHFYQPAAVARELEGAGFEVLETLEREPYPEVEAQTRRAYLLALRSP